MSPGLKILFNRLRLADLVWVLAGGALLLWLIALSGLPAPWPGLLGFIRVPLGLLYVLFIPGYLLQCALFPRRDDLDGLERLGLSLGLSVALIPLLALLLDRLPWGLHIYPVVIGQALLGELLIIAVLVRRLALPDGQVYAPDLRLRPGLWWAGLDLSERRLFGFAAAALLFTLFAAAWIFLVPSDAEFMTEFYMLGPDGLAEDFPRQAAVAEKLSVTLGITNRERTPHAYRLEIWQVDPWDRQPPQLVGSAADIHLQVGQTLEWQQSWVVSGSGQDQQFEFLLFTAADPQPYRRLLLWMDISD